MNSETCSAEKMQPWIEVTGETDPALEKELELAVKTRKEEGKFSWHDVKYVQKMHLQVKFLRLSLRSSVFSSFL